MLRTILVVLAIFATAVVCTQVPKAPQLGGLNLQIPTGKGTPFSLQIPFLGVSFDVILSIVHLETTSGLE
nr:unnamed protein product [Haemonchus contortus]